MVFFAQEEAQKYGEGYVSTEHLLLGLCREDDSTAAKVIAMMGGSLSRIRAEVEKQLPKGSARPSLDLTLTPRAKRVIDLAYDEARALNNNYIGTEHLLLGLIREGDGLAGRVLAKQKLYLEDARVRTLEVHHSEPRGEREGPGFVSSFVSLVRKRLGYDDEVPAPAQTPSNISLRTRIDFQTLHPVDQMLLAILSDEEGEFAEEIRKKWPNLHRFLPAISVQMVNTETDDRTSLSVVLADAHQLAAKAGRGETTAEDIFLACVLWTTDDVRAVLSELGLNPFRDDEIPGS